MLPLALNQRIGLHEHAGELAAAESLVEEARAVAEATGSLFAPYPALIVAARRGREADLSQLIEASMNEMVARGEGAGPAIIHWSSALLYNGLGRYEQALAAAQQAASIPARAAVPHVGPGGADRGRRPQRQARACRRCAATALADHTRASGTDWALGIEARSRALLSDNETAEALYREAIDRLARTRIRVELARAHLLYGEWLRRERRRSTRASSSAPPTSSFTEFGMEAFAERARVELEATGEHARKRTVETRDDLTPQEAQISRLAADGATNQEIAAQLFISPSTVDYHLRKAFRKLGVKSRHQLTQHLLQPGAHADTGARAY